MWEVLPIVTRFHIVCLFVSAVYISYSLGSKLLCQPTIARGKAACGWACCKPTAVSDGPRDRKLAPVQHASFLAFGIFFANQTISTLRAVRFSAMSLSGATIDIFVPPTIFAPLVFVTLTFLHSFQWIVNTRLDLKFASISLHEE